MLSSFLREREKRSVNPFSSNTGGEYRSIAVATANALSVSWCWWVFFFSFFRPRDGKDSYQRRRFQWHKDTPRDLRCFAAAPAATSVLLVSYRTTTRTTTTTLYTFYCVCCIVFPYFSRRRRRRRCCCCHYKLCAILSSDLNYTM